MVSRWSGRENIGARSGIQVVRPKILETKKVSWTKPFLTDGIFNMRVRTMRCRLTLNNQPLIRIPIIRNIGFQVSKRLSSLVIEIPYVSRVETRM